MAERSKKPSAKDKKPTATSPVSKSRFVKRSVEGKTSAENTTEKKGDRPRRKPGPAGYKKKAVRSNAVPRNTAPSKVKNTDTIRLNRYIANSGICSRREADEIIKNGLIEVNGKAITEMGFQVKMGDRVTYAGERISPEKPIYILLNKPKDFITTTKDPEGRRTVLSLIRGIGESRIYPVGRLDRLTTGLLLLTNDGALAKKLTHPSHGVKKLYHVQLDKPFKAADMKALKTGIILDDGPMQADDVQYVEGKNKKEVGIEIHSGKNRIVRRMFEHLGYEVRGLDRVIFAGLTKKDLPRGKWRHLTQQELNTLKML